MDSKTKEQKFIEIEKAYKDIDENMKKTNRTVFDTKVGIYGAAKCIRLFNFFKDINLQDYKRFIDLGSGDGRAVAIASLFTDATGIEFDKELVELSEKTAKKLDLKCAFIQNDFLELDLSQYDFIFINPDKGFDKGLEEKLIKEMKGVLFVDNNIFPPNKLKKGKSYWYNQIPTTRYTIHEEEPYVPLNAKKL